MINKSNDMKTILLTNTIVIFSLFVLNSQTVYVTDTESWADITVYVTDTEAWATGNEGKWYFTDTEAWADKTVYFTDTEAWADLTIYFTDTEAWAGWKDRSKMHLLE